MSKFNKLRKLIEDRQNSLVPIPEDMYYRPSTMGSQTSSMSPGWQTDRNHIKRTPLMLWIECRDGDLIPEELKYPDWQIDRDWHNSTPLMLWIHYRQGELGDRRSPQSTSRTQFAQPLRGASMCAIPEDMYYPGWQTDRDQLGQTPLMLWIYYHEGDLIPEELKYPNWQTDRDKDGQTPLMLWIEHREGEPIPEDMKYLGWQTDRGEDGQTPIVRWFAQRFVPYRDCPEPIPEDMFYDGWEDAKDANQRGLIEIWERWTVDKQNEPDIITYLKRRMRIGMKEDKK